MAGSEEDAPLPLQQTDLQTGISGHSKKSGTDAHQRIQTGDEGDCGTYLDPFDRLRDLLDSRPIGAQTQQDHLVLLAARNRECSGGGKGVLQLAYEAYWLQLNRHRREELAGVYRLAGLHHPSQGEETDPTGSFLGPAEAGATDQIWRDVD